MRKITNILIIGHGRHGKDTTAEIIHRMHGLSYKNSSTAAAEIFLYDALKDKYGYENPQECFEDRVNHRAEWHDLICEYNKDDKARLAKDILQNNNIYVGMRSNAECAECVRQGLFDLILAVYSPYKEYEPKSSFDIDIWERAHVVIPNTGTIEDLTEKVKKLRL